METATTPAVTPQTDAKTIADLLPVAIADHPVAQAVVANELTSRMATGKSAGAASTRAAAVEVIVQNASH